jgi:hypothetical protein
VEAYNQDGRNLMLNDKISVYGQCPHCLSNLTVGHKCPQLDKENDDDFTKQVECILSMCTDCLLGKITKGTFTKNLKMIAKIMEKNGQVD